MMCSKCGLFEARSGQRWCKPCHAAHMRAWSKTHPISPETRAKVRIRAFTRTYANRGKIERKSCETCGSPKSEIHHLDYTIANRLNVKWLCRDCHLAEHRQQRAS